MDYDSTSNEEEEISYDELKNQKDNQSDKNVNEHQKKHNASKKLTTKQPNTPKKSKTTPPRKENKEKSHIKTNQSDETPNSKKRFNPSPENKLKSKKHIIEETEKTNKNPTYNNPQTSDVENQIKKLRTKSEKVERTLSAPKDREDKSQTTKRGHSIEGRNRGESAERLRKEWNNFYRQSRKDKYGKDTKTQKG